MALITFNFYSNCLMRNVSANAIIPFEQSETHSFKTLYLLHGLTDNKDGWLLHSRIYQWAQEKNLAVIMPNGENMFYLDNDTLKDRHGEFVGCEIVQASRKLFCLSDKREDTFIAGLSMGGYGAIRTGLKYHETFGYLAGMSPALIMDMMQDSEFRKMREPFHEWLAFGKIEKVPGSDKDPRTQVKTMKENNANFPYIYLSCGTDDILIKPTRELHDCLQKHNIPHTFVEEPGNHDWDFWNKDIQRVLDWLPLS
jgi:S-formylglutathione hydrolase FrmB